MMEYWNDGILEWWNIGMMEYWNGGILESIGGDQVDGIIEKTYRRLLNQMLFRNH